MNDLIESYTVCAGVDTSMYLPRQRDRQLFLSTAINRSCINGANETRPPFVEVDLSFQTEEDEYIFRNAAITATKFYEGEYPLFSPYYIVVVGDRVMAGFLKIGRIDFITIHKGINPEIAITYLGQALNLLYLQNNSDFPLFWTGKSSEVMKLANESKYSKGAPMPIGKMSCYAHGRIFVATAQNLVYASDFIYAQGLAIEQRESVLSFSESKYPSSGDGFGAPSEMGSINGMVAVPQSNTLNGYGDVLAMCSNGVFSISPNRKLRNEWTDDPEMQKHVIIGKGCVSHTSISIFSNQIMYRDSSGGISSLNLDISTYQGLLDFNSISEKANKYLGYDNNSSDIRYSCSSETSKRLLVSVGCQKEISKEMGVHKYGIGIVSACLQRIEGKTNLAWEGLWTGVRPCSMVSAVIAGSKKCIIASFDSDKQNRIYILNESSLSDDYSNGARKPIASRFSYRGVFFDEGFSTPMVNKALGKVECFMLNSNPVSFSASFSVNGLDSDNPINFQLTEVSGHGRTTIRKLSEDICSQSGSTQNNKNPKEGYYYNITFDSEGRTLFAKVSVSGIVTSAKGFSSTKCEASKSFYISSLPQVNNQKSIEDLFYHLP